MNLPPVASMQIISSTMAENGAYNRSFLKHALSSLPNAASEIRYSDHRCQPKDEAAVRFESLHQELGYPVLFV